MDDKIVKELREIVDKFDKGEYVLNTERIITTELKSQNFIDRFCISMHEFKLAVKPTASIFYSDTIAQTLRKNEYEEKCKNFHQSVMVAKTLDLFKNKTEIESLTKYKNRCSELENELEKSKSVIEELKEQKISLKTQLEMCVNRYPTLKSFLGMEQDSEVSEVERKDE